VNKVLHNILTAEKRITVGLRKLRDKEFHKPSSSSNINNLIKLVPKIVLEHVTAMVTKEKFKY